MLTKVNRDKEIERLMKSFAQDAVDASRTYRGFAYKNQIPDMIKLFERSMVEARQDEIKLFVDDVAPKSGSGETWMEWSWRVYKYLKFRIEELKKMKKDISRANKS